MPQTGNKGLIQIKKLVWQGPASLFSTVQEPQDFSLRRQGIHRSLFLGKGNSGPHLVPGAHVLQG